MKMRLQCLAVLAAMLISLIVPVYAEQTATDLYKTDGLIINKVEISENTVEVSGKSDADVTAALIRPGYEYSDVETAAFFNVVSDLDYFKADTTGFSVKFYEENVSDSYSMYLSNGLGQIEIPVSEYLRNTTIYVSPNGNDENDGTQNSPLKTLDAARKLVREYNGGDGNITVILQEGTYDWESVEFTAEDSGTENVKITYSADGASFRGTKEIPFSKFSKVTDTAVLAKLKDNAAGNVLVANLAECGITEENIDFLSSHNAGSTVSEVGVYVDSVRQTLSRYPNDGFMKIDGVINEGGNLRENEGEGIVAQFFQYDENLSRWEGADSAYGVGFFGVEFYSEWAEIAAIDGSLQTITFADRTMYGVKQNYKWYITNLIEEMDIPGEWYIDKAEMKLYYFPAEDFGANSKFEIAVETTPLLYINGASNITFEGFEIFATQSDGVKAVNVDGITIKNFDISHARNHGINISGNNNTIDGNVIHNTYDAGIYVAQGGHRMSLTPSGNVISNNHIYKTGTDAASNWNGGIYVWRDNVGTQIKNNLIHSIKNYSYSFGGNANVFSHNEVWSGNRETADTIPVYCGRDWSEYGNKILYNYIHDCYNKDTDIVYWNYGLASGDDAHAGTIIENNIVKLGKQTRTVAIGTGSRDNVVKNNIMIGAQYGIYMTNPNQYINDWLNTDADNIKTIIGTLEKSTSLEEGYSTTEPWLAAYPQISTIRADLEANNGAFRPRNDIITGNISVNADNYIEEEYYPAEDGNVISNNQEFDNYDIFEDPDNHDYRITSEAMTTYGFDSGVINRTNFEMTDIGIQSEISAPSTAFKLTWPYNGTAVEGNELALSWTEAEFSDEYYVEVASDADFNNIVYDDTTLYNRIYPEGLSSGNTYYWRVTAKNLSKQIGNEWGNSNGVYSFTVAEGDVDASASSYKVTDEATVVNLDITNYSATAVSDATMYFAFYDGDDLVGVKTKPLSLATGATHEEVISYTDLEEFSGVKLLLWDSDQTPLMEVVRPYERQYIVGEEYEFTSFERNGSGWTNKYFWGILSDIWNTSTTGDSAEFTITAPSSGSYDLYYYVQTPKSGAALASSASVEIETLGGISGGNSYTTQMSMDVTDTYVYIGRYTLTAADNTAWGTVTVTNSVGDGCLPAVKMKAVRVY